MTLIISTLTASGVVLTADSRQAYRNTAGAIRVGSDSAMKIFTLTSRCGVAISGRAFLREDNQPLKDAGYFIRRFTESEDLEGLATREVAERLNESLSKILLILKRRRSESESKSRYNKKEAVIWSFPRLKII